MAFFCVSFWDVFRVRRGVLVERSVSFGESFFCGWVFWRRGGESDGSTANSLTDRLGAGQRTKHIVTRYFWIQERVQDGDLSIKKVPTAKNCADVGTKPVSASVLQQHCKFAGLVFY